MQKETVKCNMCGWHGEEEELVTCYDVEFDERIKGCPECLTDNYLMDI